MSECQSQDGSIGVNKSFTSKNFFNRIFNAAKYSMAGLSSAFQTEKAFQQDVVLVVINTIATFVFVKPSVVMLILVLLGLNVLVAELINTAIEYVVDRIGTERHDLSGKAKDVGSAIVFMAIVELLIGWCYHLMMALHSV